MYSGFIERAQAVERLLHDRRTTFAVVTTLEGAPLREAEFFCEELTTRGYHLGALLLNKTLPALLLADDGASAAAALEADADSVAAELKETVPALADPTSTARVLRTIAASYRNFAVIAQREAELRAELERLPDVVVTIPELEGDITDLEGLAAIGRYLLGANPDRQ